MMTEYQQKIEEFDLIYLDSFHNANYVKKIFYYYYKMLKKDGVFYFDDISNIPYLKDNYRNNFNCEINNKNLNESKKILSRKHSLKNFLRKLIYR